MKVQELAASIRAKNIITPLLVRPNGKGFEIAAGHRRYRTAALAELERLPCVVRPMEDAECIEVLNIENLQRDDLTPLDRGRVVVDCGATRTADDLVRFMERIAALYPTDPVHVIWDNLNIHFDGADQRWTAFNARHGQRFIFHYTPKHASWVNQVELFFSILQRQCLRDASFRSVEDLRTAVLAFIAAWNRDRAQPFRWTFTGYPLQAGAAVESVKAA